MKTLPQRRDALAVLLLFAIAATTAGGQETSEMRCRGGGFWIDTVGTRVHSTGETILILSLQFNYTAQWVQSVPVSATHEIPAHWELGRSSCAWLGTSNGGPYESAKPAKIRFETPANAQLKQKLHGSEVDTSPTAAERYPDARTIPEYLRSSNHYWSFHISKLVCAPPNCEAPGSRVLHLEASAHGHYKQPIVRHTDDFKARKPNRPIDASGLSTREAASEPVRPQARVRLPGGTASKTTLTKCEAAKLARARNSPAAPGLEAQCAAQLAIEASSAASSTEAIASQSRVTRKADLQRKVADENQRLEEISAELDENLDESTFGKFGDWLVGGDPQRASGVGFAVTKQGAGAAARRAAPAFQPENTIAVRVRYPKEYGYKADTSALGPVGPASCAVFSISATATEGSARQRNPISISRNSKIVEGDDYYVCNYIASGVPLDQAIAVNVAVVGPDLSAAWEGGDAAEPPAGQQRTILDATRTATLNASLPRQSQL